MRSRSGTVEFFAEQFQVSDGAEFKAPPFGNVTGKTPAFELVAE